MINDLQGLVQLIINGLSRGQEISSIAFLLLRTSPTHFLLSCSIFLKILLISSTCFKGEEGLEIFKCLDDYAIKHHVPQIGSVPASESLPFNMSEDDQYIVNRSVNKCAGIILSLVLDCGILYQFVSTLSIAQLINDKDMNYSIKMILDKNIRI